MKKRNLITTVCSALLATSGFAQSGLPKEIKVGKERVKARTEINLPAIDGYQLLKCDFHIHTMFSDGIVWPSLRVSEAWEEGLDAIAITEHIEGQPARDGVMKGNHNYSYDLAEEEAKRKNIILIKGGEITRAMPPGHLNAIFMKDVNGLDKKDYMDAIEEANRQGAFVFWNHPGWGVDEIKWHDVHTQLYEKGWLHGIEVFNEFEWYPQALLWAREKNLTLIANTDVHDVTERLYDRITAPHRPMTLVLSKDRSQEGIREALFARRTILFFFNTLMANEELLDKFFKASVEIESPHYIKEQRKFVTIRNNSSVPFRLVKKEQVQGYPYEIEIPAMQSIVVTLPSADQNKRVPYEVTNLITGVNEFLNLRLF